MFEMWFLTVFGLMKSSRAISALSLPIAMSRRTSTSRSDSSVRIVCAAAVSAYWERRRWRTFAAIWGEISDSPLAAARMPAISWSMEESFSR